MRIVTLTLKHSFRNKLKQPIKQIITTNIEQKKTEQTVDILKHTCSSTCKMEDLNEMAHVE